VGTLGADDTISSAIDAVQDAIDGIEDAQEECDAYGKAITKAFNSAKKKVRGLKDDISDAEKKKDKNNDVCKEKCKLKKKKWKPKIYFKPSGCGNRIAKRIKACIQVVKYSCKIVAYKIAMALANIVLTLAKLAVNAIEYVIELIMAAALAVVSAALVILQALRLALVYTLNTLRKVDDLRGAVTCSGINALKFSIGFFLMDILLINEFIFNMEYSKGKLEIDARFVLTFFGTQFDISMKISLSLDSIISGFTTWIKEQFMGIFSGGGDSGAASTDLTGCWDEDAAATLGADFRAADLGALTTDHPAAARLLADHGHFLHRRLEVKDPSVFFFRPGGIEGDPAQRERPAPPSTAAAKLGRLVTPASARHSDAFLPHPPHVRDQSRHAPEALSRVVDNELEAYAALAATLSAATLRLPLAGAVVEWSDTHAAAAAAAAGLGTQQHVELLAKRDSALNAVLSASLGAVRAHEAKPHAALAHALKGLPVAAANRLDAFVPDFNTRGPQVLASAPALAFACFPRVQSDMLRTLHDAVAHAQAAVDDKSTSAAGISGSVSAADSSPTNRRLLGGAAAPRRASAAAAAAGWTDDIVRRAPAGSTPRDALAAALRRDASNVAAALGAGSGGVADSIDSTVGVSAAAAAAAAAAATVDPCRGAKAVAAVSCAAAAFWTKETRAPGAVAMCGHAISTLSTLVCDDVPGAESCAAAATAALPCSAPCTASLGAVRSACDALVPRSQHGRFIERSAAGHACRHAVMAAHHTCSPSDGTCAALLEAMPESLSREFKTARGATHHPAWWEEQDAWGVIPPGLGASHYHAIHLSRNKLMGRVPKSMWSDLHPEATAVIIANNLLAGDVPGPLAPHVRRVLATRNRLSGDLGEVFGAAAAAGSLVTLHVAHNRFSAPDGLAAFARLGARSLERLHINHNDFAPSAEASRQLPAHIASMAKLRQYSLAGNRWAYEEVAAGANQAAAAAESATAAAVASASATTAAAAAALGGAHAFYPDSLGSPAVDVQLTFPGLTSAWFCASCAALPSHDDAFLSETARHMCVDRMDTEKTCGDEALFAAARCVLQELLPKRVLAEAGATVSGVDVYEVADTAAGLASLSST